MYHNSAGPMICHDEADPTLESLVILARGFSHAGVQDICVLPNLADSVLPFVVHPFEFPVAVSLWQGNDISSSFFQRLEGT